jgi:Domain of unknown function (DUF397)
MPLTGAVELACGWRKASYSVNNGQCVEVGSASLGVLVRDSVNPSGAVVAYPPAAWEAFITSARAGAYDSFH